MDNEEEKNVVETESTEQVDSVLPTKEENDKAKKNVNAVLQAFMSVYAEHKGGDLNG